MIPSTSSSETNSRVVTSTPRGAVLVLLWAAATLLFCIFLPARADAPRALAPGQLPNDVRLEPLKDLDGYFPFTPCQSKAEWAKRAERVRRQMQVALGLWPMPTRTPLHPVIHGRIDREEYTVEKVYFESLPGFFVTGNLYRPKGKSGKLPGVLCPHGHWDNGRFTDAGLNRVRQEIVQGAERFEEGGRSPLQARCVQLARMGCVVFHYDMIGYADSQQISFELAHRFAKERPEMNAVENWGLFSPQAEAHLQSVLGLQAWNSIRALDFLLGLPEIGPERIAVTGASGGGTQTFILCAVDPRPALAFPAVMVSTAMQGGCTCENASLLRVDTGNVEFAALFAPKPLGLTAANDWTREMATKGFPELKKHYALEGAPDQVMLTALTHFGHNYNYVSRAAMYGWVNKHFKLGLPEPVIEEDYRRLSQPEMTVWDEAHPKPPGGPDFERKLLRWLTEDAENQLRGARQSAAEYRRVVGGAVEALIGRNLAEAGQTEWNQTSKEDRGDYVEVAGLLRNTTYGEEVPALCVYPNDWNGQTVLWMTETGKAGLFEPGTGGARSLLKPDIKKLLDSGAAVIGLDLLFQGEFLADGKPVTQTRRVKNTREAAAYTFGYNRALFARRVHDILSVVKFIRSRDRQPESLDLVGLDGTGPLVAAARALAGRAIDRAAVNTGGFRFGKVLEIHDVNFLPGGARYDDLPGLLALGAPGKLWLAGEGERAPEIASRIYAVAGAGDRVAVSSATGEQATKAALEWLLSRR